jgi:hypothetical protein
MTRAALACLLLPGPSAAQVGTPGRAPQSPPAATAYREVTTSRSDGAVFPAVRQEQRRQRSRVVSVTSSVQALGAPGNWESRLDPAEGGVTLAPAGAGAGTGADIAIGVLVAPERPSRPRSSGRPRGN